MPCSPATVPSAFAVSAWKMPLQVPRQARADERSAVPAGWSSTLVVAGVAYVDVVNTALNWSIELRVAELNWPRPGQRAGISSVAGDAAADPSGMGRTHRTGRIGLAQ